MPPKKRKADAPAEDATPKKKMTKKEKQQALERARQSMEPTQARVSTRGSAAAAIASPKKPAARRPAKPAAAKPSSQKTKGSKHQQLEEARARATEWAADERTRQTKSKAPAAASAGPPPSRPSIRGATSKQKKQSKATKSPSVQPKTRVTKKPKKEATGKKKGDKKAEAKQTKSSSRSWRKATLVLILLSVLAGAAWLALLSSQKEQLKEWQTCKIFLAPSTLPGVDWGVFAAVDFEEGDVVEIEPLLIAFDWDAPIAHNSILDDFGFSFVRRFVEGEQEHFKTMSAVIYGYMMAYNHHPSQPNVQNHRFGDEPSEENPNSSLFMGMVAKRHISPGEELFTTYGQEDGGALWFQSRRLSLESLPQSESRFNGSDLVSAMQKHCPKLYAGPGTSTWWDRVEIGQERPSDSSRFPESDAGIGAVVARVDLSPGDVIETAPALTLHWNRVQGTALAPLTFRWNELESQHTEALQSLRDAGKLKVQHQGPDTEWERVDRWEGFDQLAILPGTGGIGMVDRVGDTPEAGDANCRLEIRSDDEVGDSLVLGLVATKEIQAGQVLKLNLRAVGSHAEATALLQELQKDGHPIGANIPYLLSVGEDEA